MYHYTISCRKSKVIYSLYAFCYNKKERKGNYLESYESSNHCQLCPRRCGADRRKSSGFCGGGSLVKVARAAPHFWEEPCISGKSGSGTVFFSGCPLSCCFCQNYEISRGNFGKEISVQRLAEIFQELEGQGVHNINLVSPTHWQPQILQALSLAGLKLPVVWNSGGYESADTLKALEGHIAVFLPDLKFYSSERSSRYASAPDYFQQASLAILEMFRQTGPCVFDPDGMLQKGVIIRHLALPKGREDSKKLLGWIAGSFPPGAIRISLMSQYTPCIQKEGFPELKRRVSTFEYEDVVNYALSLGLVGYMQERSSAQAEYTPSFDLTGI